MFTHILIIAYCSAVGLAISVFDCPSGLTRNKYLKAHGNTCYRFAVYERKSFQDAQDDCSKDGGVLAMIKSDSVDKYLKHALKDDYKTYYTSLWIGLRSKFGEFNWVDGSKLDFSLLHTNSQDMRSEECVALSADSTDWSAYKCGSRSLFEFEERHGYICQYSVTKTDPSHSNDGCPVQRGDAIKSMGSKCYYFIVKERLGFNRSESYCEKLGGTLALVKSKKINDFLKYHLSVTQGLENSYESVWIGLKYSGSPRVPRWVDGTPLVYNHFPPNTITYFSDCVAMSPVHGYWRTAYCTDSSIDVKHFICEFEKNITSATSTIEPQVSKSTTDNLVLPSTPPQATKEDCPIKSENDEDIKVLKNKCYYFATYEGLAFDKAENFCENHGGTLAIVTSKIVSDFLQSHLQKMNKDRLLFSYSKNFWIGLTLSKADNKYHWVDGTKVGFRNFRYSGANGDCGMMSSSDGKWVTSFNCDGSSLTAGNQNHFICEFNTANSSSNSKSTMPPLSTLPPPSLEGCPVERLNAEDINAFENKCYYFAVNERASFYNADKTCEHYGGELALVKSKPINDFLEYHLRHTHNLDYRSDPLWIGLRFSRIRDEYHWLDGMKVNFTNFRHITAYGECVAISPSDGSWEDFYCSSKSGVESDKHSYICEFDKEIIQTTADPAIGNSTVAGQRDNGTETTTEATMSNNYNTTRAPMMNETSFNTTI